jgi:prepilin-type N-terminal cleavage/methylation domain-containing protein
MRRRWTYRRGDERGFTLTEMVTVVAILGVIIGPLTIAMSETLNFLPSAGARTSVSVRQSLAINQVSDDVVNSTDCPAFWLTDPGPAVQRCGATPPVASRTFSCSAPATTPLFVLTYSSDTSGASPGTTWTITWKLTFAADPNGTAFNTVALERDLSPGGSSTVYPIGYCAVGPLADTVATLDNKADSSTAVKSTAWLHLAVSSRASATEPLRTVQMSAAAGCSVTTNAPTGCGQSPPTQST